MTSDLTDSPTPVVIDPAERHLPLPGTRNLRDVGGYPAAGGRRTRWRTLLRTDSLDSLPDASQAALLETGPAPGHRPALAVRAGRGTERVPGLRPGALHQHPAAGRRPDRSGSGSRACIDTSSMSVPPSWSRSSGRCSSRVACRPSSAAPPARTGPAWPSRSSSTRVGVPRDVIVEDYALSAPDVRASHGRPAPRRLAFRAGGGREPSGVHGIVARAPRRRNTAAQPSCCAPTA